MDTYLGLREITVIDCIWEAILEVVCIVAEILECDEETVLKQVIVDNRRMALLSQLAQAA